MVATIDNGAHHLARVGDGRAVEDGGTLDEVGGGYIHGGVCAIRRGGGAALGGRDRRGERRELLSGIDQRVESCHHSTDDETCQGQADREEALRSASSAQPELVLLDLGLPGIDGIDVIRGPRARTETPIIVLSALEVERDKITALDVGADDYVTKPLSMAELLARLRAAVRRNIQPDVVAPVVTPDFTIDLVARRVTLTTGEVVRLTPTEWHIVDMLARNEGRLVTQQQLLHAVWGPHHERHTNYLRVHLAHIRRKLEPMAAEPRYIKTEAGMGYRFVSGT